MSSLTENKVAVLGASGHIAQGLVYNFSKHGWKNVHLFARSKEKVVAFLERTGCQRYEIHPFDELERYDYRAVINCVGAGTPAKVKAAGGEIFFLTEDFDNIVLRYLRKHPRAKYINFSSGAVYGTFFPEKVNDSSRMSIGVNGIKPDEYYGIAKLHSEAKHRAIPAFHIVDIRVFSYFSRFIDLESGYFLTELIKCLKAGRTFVTNQCDFMRDFISPEDLFALVALIIRGRGFNRAVDAYSSSPINKFKLLDFFSDKYSLNYAFDEELAFSGPTGEKNHYYSGSKKAAGIGYRPKFSSIAGIAAETTEIMRMADD
ncbi:MAG: NAD-dependent epimerase/dehydratase family protein [Candidatus Omnitrophota bacterium]